MNEGIQTTGSRMLEKVTLFEAQFDLEKRIG
jgi:hypothetical protein